VETINIIQFKPKGDKVGLNNLIIGNSLLDTRFWLLQTLIQDYKVSFIEIQELYKFILRSVKLCDMMKKSTLYSVYLSAAWLIATDKVNTDSREEYYLLYKEECTKGRFQDFVKGFYKEFLEEDCLEYPLEDKDLIDRLIKHLCSKADLKYQDMAEQ
jgi:hypothetical protein